MGAVGTTERSGELTGDKRTGIRGLFPSSMTHCRCSFPWYDNEYRCSGVRLPTPRPTREKLA
jgi:hypothetical protein